MNALRNCGLFAFIFGAFHGVDALINGCGMFSADLVGWLFAGLFVGIARSVYQEESRRTSARYGASALLGFILFLLAITHVGERCGAFSTLKTADIIIAVIGAVLGLIVFYVQDHRVSPS